MLCAMIADKIEVQGKTSVQNGTKKAKKGTNLSLSEQALSQAEALKTAMKRTSLTNLVEVLIHNAHEVEFGKAL